MAAYEKAAAAGLLPAGITAEPAVEIPKDTANGDYTTTFCLAAAKAMKMNASLQFAEGLLWVKAAVTVLLEFTGYVARGEEIDGRRIQKFQ